MRLYCDSHIHIYPNYDLVRALDSLCAGLARAGAMNSGAQAAAVFCERHDCAVFSSWKKLQFITPVTEVEKITDCALNVRHREQALTIFAGRQLNTSERLEFLAYGVEEHIGDRLSWEDTISSIRANGGLPVLNWAAGKWMFGRKSIVEQIVRSVAPGDLALCDTTLRCLGWPEPDIMRLERKRGRAVFAGSDPLPNGSEEKLLGSYGCWADIRADRLGFDVLRRLSTGEVGLSTFGNRSNPIEFCLRQGRHFALR